MKSPFSLRYGLLCTVVYAASLLAEPCYTSTQPFLYTYRERDKSFFIYDSVNHVIKQLVYDGTTYKEKDTTFATHLTGIKSVSHLGTTNGHIWLVADNKFCFIPQFGNESTVVEPLLLANEDTTVVAATSCDIIYAMNTSQKLSTFVFALRSPQGSDRLAVVYLDKDAEGKYKLHPLNEQGDISSTEFEYRDLPLNFISDNGVPSEDVHINDLYFNVDLQTLFIGLSATTGINGDAGVRSVLVGRFEQAFQRDKQLEGSYVIKKDTYRPLISKKPRIKESIRGPQQQEKPPALESIFLYLLPSTHESLFYNTHAIIGTRGAEETVCTHKLKTLTAHGLSYLIVVGGNGLSENTQSQVYALPIAIPQRMYVAQDSIEPLLTEQSITAPSSALTKTLSQKYGLGHTIRRGIRDRLDYGGIMVKKDGKIKPISAGTRTIDKTFSSLAQKPYDLYSDQEDEARVGGTATLPGPIQDIQIYADNVFVAVSSTDNTGGIFFSHALYTPDGNIKRWSDWQRAYGIEHNMRSCLMTDQHQFFYFTENNSFNRVQWDTQDALIIQELNKLKTITCVSEVSAQQKSSEQAGFETPLLLAAGSNYVVGFTNRTLTHTLHSNELKKLSTITSTTLIPNGESTLLVIGGESGLALCRDWQPETLVILPYAHIRKLVSTDSGFYVLTTSHLDRLNIATSFEQKRVCAQTLARADLYESTATGIHNTFFSDVLISGPLALLATTRGLLRSGNGNDISQATTASDITWKEIDLPDGVGSKHTHPVMQLVPFSRNGQEDTLVHGGNVYVINAHPGFHQTHLYRLSIDLTDQVTDTTVSLFNDSFYWDQQSGKQFTSFYLNLMGYYSNFTSDGTGLYGIADDGLLTFTEPHPQSGIYTTGSIMNHIQPLTKTRTKQGPVRLSSGSWLLATSSGCALLH